MWTLQYLPGAKAWLDHNGVLISRTIYSGFGAGVNNPLLEHIRNVGPLPVGDWDIFGPPVEHTEHGKYVLRLEPRKGTNTFGRVAFLFHGDELEHPGEHLASHGCMVDNYVTRMRAYQSGDTFLRVIANLNPSGKDTQP